MDGGYEQALNDCQLELDSIRLWINTNKLHTNVRYLVAYAVVKSCGTIERVLKLMLFDHFNQNANAEATSHFSNYLLEASFNPSPGQIEKQLAIINASWKDAFCLKIKDTNQKGQLKSLVELRNSFSHGTPITSSIDEVITYFNAGRWVLIQLNDVMHNR